MPVHFSEENIKINNTEKKFWLSSICSHLMMASLLFFHCFSLRHVGDLGNMLQSAQGVASTQFRDEVISLQGQGSILGRSLVVRLHPHSHPFQEVFFNRKLKAAYHYRHSSVNSRNIHLNILRSRTFYLSF